MTSLADTYMLFSFGLGGAALLLASYYLHKFYNVYFYRNKPKGWHYVTVGVFFIGLGLLSRFVIEITVISLIGTFLIYYGANDLKKTEKRRK